MLTPHAAQAQNLPQGGRVISGIAAIQTGDHQLNVSQSGQAAVLDWNSFSIGTGNTVNFAQPDARSVTLNLVSGTAPSTIAGSLTATGTVFLLNPNGIAITPSGQVHVGSGFVASTLALTDIDSADGLHFRGNGHSTGVSNAGLITVGAKGFAALVGGSTANSGTITVPMGHITLAAGEAATIDTFGDGYLQLALPAVSGAQARHASVPSLLQLSGQAARQAWRQIVYMPPSVAATSSSVEGHTIVLVGEATGTAPFAMAPAGHGIVSVTGTLDASTASGTGGTINVVGREITLTNARLNASGLSGGTIAVGGGIEGTAINGMASSTSTIIDAGTLLNASAHAGTGGRITVWGTDKLSYAGMIAATGNGGDGGNAEISGHGAYDYAGSANLLSTGGKAGTLLLDPYNLTISTATSSNHTGYTATGNSAVVNVSALQSSLATASVTVSTGSSGSQTGTITVSAPITWSAATTLTLNAAAGIIVGSGNNITASGGGSLTLNAIAGGIAVNAATLSTTSGTIALTATNAGATNAITLSGASINAGTGSATLTGTSTSGYGIILGTSNTLTTTGTINLNGTSATSHGIYLANAAGITTSSGTLTLTGNSTSGYGIWLFGGTQNVLNNGTGTISMSGTSSSQYGVALNSTFNSTGTVTISGATISGYGLYFNGTTVTANSGNLSLSGRGGSANGTWINGNTLSLVNHGSGLLSLTGTTTTGTGGVRFNNNANLSLTGNVALSGTSTGSTFGLSFKGGNTITIVSGTPTLAGSSASGSGLLFQGATSISNSSGSQVTLSGGSTSGVGAQLPTGSSLTTSGALVISGTSSSGNGLEVDGTSASIVAITNASGAAGLSGISASGNGIALAGYTNITNSGSRYTITGSSANSSAYGLAITSGALVSTSGGLKLTDAASSGASTAIDIAGTLSGSSGTLSLVPTSTNGITIESGGVLSSSGTAALSMTTNGGGAITNLGAISGGGTGTISLSATGTGAIAGETGTITQSGSGALSLITASGAISTGAISYQGSGANTLTISSGGTVTVDTGIAASSGALTTAITAPALRLASSITTADGSQTYSGPVTLIGNTTMAAGGGSISFSGTVDGAYALTANAASMSLGGRLGATTSLGAVSLTSQTGLSLPSINASSILANVTNSGAALTISSGEQLTASGSGTPVVLSAEKFTNNSGRGAISTANGRWLIYSAAPSGDTLNELNSANVAIWAATYASTSGSLSQTGNRYVFAYQPTLTFTSTNQSKTYGTDNSAALASAYTVSGYQPAVSGAYLTDSSATAWNGTPSITSGGSAALAQVSGSPYTITIAAGSVAGLNGYATAFSLAGTLTINRAPLTITGATTSSTYNGSAQTNGWSITSGQLYGSDSISSLSGLGSGTNAGIYADSLSAATGSGLANYAITYANGSLAIGKATLTLTGANNAATYNGQLQTNSGASYTGRQGSDSFTISGYASGTNAGSYSDALGVTANGTTLLSNYNVVIRRQGSLNILPPHSKILWPSLQTLPQPNSCQIIDTKKIFSSSRCIP